MQNRKPIGTYQAIHIRSHEANLTEEAKEGRQYPAAFDKEGRTWRVTEEEAAEIEANAEARRAKA